MFKKVAYNTGSQILGKIVTASTTLLVTILIGRSLGPAGYGEFSKIFVFVGYFYTFSDFGLNSIFIKLSQTKNPSNLFRTLIGFRLILAVFLALTAILVSLFLPYDPQTNIGFSPLVKTGIIIASLTIITQAFLTTANALFQKNLRYDFSTIAVTCGSLVILILAIFATLQKFPLLAYIWVYVFGGIIFILVAYFLIVKKFKKSIIPHFSPKEFIILLKLAWPVGLALIFNLIYFRIDVLILANTRTSAEVGLYNLAYQFFEAALAIPIFFSNALYPILAKLYHQDLGDYQKQVRFWAIFLTLSSFCLIALLLFASLFIPLIYSPNFAPSQSALRVLSLGMPFFFISALLWHLLIIHDKQKYLLFIYGTGALFNLIANLIFIPQFGYLAASSITVISEALIMILLAVALKIPQTIKTISPSL